VFRRVKNAIVHVSDQYEKVSFLWSNLSSVSMELVFLIYLT